MAEGLAEAGAALVLCARRDEWLTPTVERFQAQGVRCEGLVADVARPADVQAVVDIAMQAFGQVDILVNNAGITWGARPEEMPLDQWQRVLDINLTGAFLFAQAAGREMLKRQYGRIINVASIAGLHASVLGPHYAGYAATKAGLMGLTRELAASWGATGFASMPSPLASSTRDWRIRRSRSSSPRSRLRVPFRASARQASSKAWPSFWPRTRRTT